jgi:hypothetical protein
MVSIRQLDPDDEPEFPPLVWVSQAESRHQFDELARELVGMSGEEFIRRLKAGEFLDLPDEEEHRAFVELAVMSGGVGPSKTD